MTCNVGYALNPKKLRKSGIDDAGIISEQAAIITPLSSSGRTAANQQLSPIWHGGGLADIISDGLECEGVKFISWNYEVPIPNQVRLIEV